MPKCPQCGAAFAPGDHFCGACGASLSGTASPPPPDPEVSDPTKAPWSRPALIAGGLAAAGLVWLIGNYFEEQNEARTYSWIADATRGSLDGTEAASRPALDDNRTVRRFEAAQAASRPPDRSTTGDDTAVFEGAGSARPSIASAENGAQIAAGKWVFSWQIDDFAGTAQARPSTPTSSLPFGRSGQDDRCITQAMTTALRDIAFPMDPEANCVSSSHSMRGGIIEASYSCRMPGVDEPVAAAVEGSYDSNSAFATMRMRMPASAIATGSYVDEMIEVIYSYRGRRTGAC